jgi:DNA-damage-inducible protein J
MAASEVVRARINSDLKKQATNILSQMGLSVSDVIRMVLMRVAAEKALPFEVYVPNSDTKAAITAVQHGNVVRFNSLDDLMAELNDDDDDD